MTYMYDMPAVESTKPILNLHLEPAVLATIDFAMTPAIIKLTEEKNS
jgi:hypothetical protein